MGASATRRWLLVIAGAVSLSLLGACGGDDDGDGGGGEDTEAAVETVTGEEETDATVGEEEADVSDDALASRDGLVDGESVRLEIVELARTGETTSLTIQLSNLGVSTETDAALEPVEPDRAQVADTFDDQLYQGAGRPHDTLDGISLIDTVNAKRYLVARDSNGECVCDRGLSGQFVDVDAPLLLSATFGAPP
jgi:hypothetical protein